MDERILLNSFKLKENFFLLMRDGVKTIEGRLFSGKFTEMEEAELIRVFNSSNVNEFFFAKIISLRRYQSFEELLIREGMRNVLPGCGNLEDGIKVYREFYSEENEKKSGVIAIEVIVV